MAKEQKLYKYEGPVMKFDQCLDHCYRGSTYASSAAQAINYLSWRYKKDHNMASNTKLSLTGKIVQIG